MKCPNGCLGEMPRSTIFGGYPCACGFAVRNHNLMRGKIISELEKMEWGGKEHQEIYERLYKMGCRINR